MPLATWQMSINVNFGVVSYMGKMIIIVLILGIVFYLLYINGFLVINAKRAVMYVGSMRGNKATFSSCTGYTKRVIRFRENKTYRLVFNSELTQGDVSAELLDSAKQLVICLNSKARSGDINVERGKRYYLIFRFKSATGNYVLSWDERELNLGFREEI